MTDKDQKKEVPEREEVVNDETTSIEDIADKLTDKKPAISVSTKASDIDTKVEPDTKEQSSIEPKTEEVVTPEVKDTTEETNSILASILNDGSLDEITVIDEENSEFEKVLEKIVLDTTPFKQIPCLQSGYVAHLRAATLLEIDAIGELDADAHQVQLTVYKTLFNLMIETSIGNISFKDFLRITSYYDAASIMYGVYAKTSTTPNSLDIICNNIHDKKFCGEENKVTVPNDELIQVSDNEIYKNIRDMITKTSNPEELIKTSLVAKMLRKQFFNKRIITETHIPSLQDHLDGLKLGIKYPEIITGNSAVANLMMHTRRLYILNEEETIKQKKPVYNKFEDKEKIFTVITKLPPEESKPLLQDITKRDLELVIKYKTPPFKCKKCNQEIKGIDIDIEDWLFQHVLEIRG